MQPWAGPVGEALGLPLGLALGPADPVAVGEAAGVSVGVSVGASVSVGVAETGAGVINGGNVMWTYVGVGWPAAQAPTTSMRAAALIAGSRQRRSLTASTSVVHD